jgi:hydroxyacylglutathione hydrolase
VPAVLVEAVQLWLAYTNAWIVAADGPGGECLVVDVPPQPDAVLSRVLELDLRPVAILTTHGHVDHVGGIGAFVRSADPNMPVHIHDGDQHMLLDPVGTGDVLGEMLAREGLDVRPPELVYGLDDGQRVSGAGMTLTAIHTPGHTPGSTCFMLEVEGEAPLLFSGDHLFRGSIGRTDLPGGSFEQLMVSMAEKILPLADAVRVLPGHGPSTTIGHERRTNPFLVKLRGR